LNRSSKRRLFFSCPGFELFETVTDINFEPAESPWIRNGQVSGGAVFVLGTFVHPVFEDQNFAPEHVVQELSEPLLDEINSCERDKSSPGEEIEVSIDTSWGSILELGVSKDIVIALVGP